MNNNDKKTLLVSAIKDGTVIDHIPAGNSTLIVKLLKLGSHDNQVTIGINLQSKHHTLKDLIKIENRILSDTEMLEVAVFAPRATVNLIQNYKISAKIRLQLPDKISGLIACPNPNCVTQTEPVRTDFHVTEQNNSVSLHCQYCEISFPRDSKLIYSQFSAKEAE